MGDDQAAVIKAANRFVSRCRNDDGGYAPSTDLDYGGNSDTSLSDLAAVTYAVVLARTFGWELPGRDRSAEYIRKRQRPDGSFAHITGAMDPESDLAVLYNTTQAAVALRALGEKPDRDPASVLDRFFEQGAYERLPWYTTSFFPLCYMALGMEFPAHYRKQLSRFMVEHQTADGYLGDHVAATFHLAHYFRLLDEPVPGAGAMVDRTLRDQTPEGGWNSRAPDWDVHAAFDAAFILRQLGGGNAKSQQALARAASWSARCQNPDGGFGHYPGWHSDMDAVYFQLGTLVQAGALPAPGAKLPDAKLLGWGHLIPVE